MNQIKFYNKKHYLNCVSPLTKQRGRDREKINKKINKYIYIFFFNLNQKLKSLI